MFKPFGARAASRPSPSRAAAAHKAMALVDAFDDLGRDALAALEGNDGHLAELLARRDEILATLTDHLIALKLDPPAADSALLAGAERAVDSADALVLSVCEAMQSSQAATTALAARVALRSEELREEIAAVNRAGTAGHAYSTHVHGTHLDRSR